MRINDKSRSGNLNSAARSLGKVEANRSLTEKSFGDVLEKQYTDAGKAALEELLKKLDDISKRLAESFSVYELKKYKDVLQEFLHQTQGQAYRLKEKTAYSRRGHTRIMYLLEKIDAELEELSAMVLSQQKDGVRLLEKMGQIRGMLVDLYS